MKKKGAMILLAIMLVLQSQAAFASDSKAYELASGQALDVELLGLIDAPIISVVIPTQVKFAVVPDSESWNQVLSPDFTVRNTGNVMLEVSITKAAVKTEGVELTTNEPTYADSVKQVRLAVAPKEAYATAGGVSNYFLSKNVTDASPIILTEKLDYARNNDSALYNVYGDISSGWSNGEEFSVSAVFKVALTK